MSVSIITQFKTKPGRAGELLALLEQLLPSSLEHGGAEAIHIRQNQDDPTDIISDQRWASRQVYLDYRRWRSDQGVTARIEGLLAEPITVRFFDDRLDGAPTQGLGSHAEGSSGGGAAA